VNKTTNRLIQAYSIVPGNNEKSTLSRKLVVFLPSHLKSLMFQVVDFKSNSSLFGAKWGQIG